MAFFRLKPMLPQAFGSLSRLTLSGKTTLFLMADVSEEAAMHESWREKLAIEVAANRLARSEMVELPFVVPLPNKKEATILDGTALILTHLQALGYQCMRVKQHARVIMAGYQP